MDMFFKGEMEGSHGKEGKDNIQKR